MKPPVPAVRHGERRWILASHRLGLFKISPLYGYRSIDGAGSGIQDQTEGMVYAPIEHTAISSNTSEGQRLIRSGVAMFGPDVTYVRSGRFALTVPNCYVLCFSDCYVPEAFPQYDAAFEIPDLHSFAEILRQARPDKLGPFKTGAVTYRRRAFDLKREDFERPDPFVKEALPEFEGQRELRIVWRAKDNAEEPFNLISLRAAGQLRVL